MKLIGFMFLAIVFMQSVVAEEMFSYSQSMECYVKEYENKVFKNVNDDYFVGKPLRIAELKKTPGFVAFKVNGKLYVAPKKCLSSVGGIEEEILPIEQASQNLSNRDQEWEEDNYKMKKELIEKRKNQRLQESESEPTALGKKYFVELFGSKTFGGSTKPGIKDYQKNFKTYNGYPFTIETIDSGKTNLGTAFGGKIGLRNKEYNFVFLQYKKYTVKKTDSVTGSYLDTGDSNTYLVTGEFRWKYTVGQLYLGYAYCFSCKGTYGIYGNASLGINSIDLEDEEDGTKFVATTPGGELSINALYAFNNFLSLSFVVGYDIQIGGTYKLKGTENSEISTGFESDVSLGGPFTSLGLRVHF